MNIKSTYSINQKLWIIAAISADPDTLVPEVLPKVKAILEVPDNYITVDMT